ncbi:hypothetical protein BJV82DRAFT_678730 [Fennellomyces sp. T-0311]|nr:hypothetical protein BJV82DRAFT_678730 [Fennellomyces sp. T-0311]
MPSIYGQPQHSYGTIIKVFEKQVALHPSKACLLSQGPQGKLVTLTYQQVDRITETLAHQWGPLVVNTQTIAFLGDSQLQTILAFLAILKLHRTFFPISTRNSSDGIIHLLNETCCGLLIATDKFAKVAQDCASNIKLQIWQSIDLTQLGEAPIPQDQLPYQYKPLANDDVVLITHSSGSTSFPKPYTWTNQSFLYSTVEVVPNYIQRTSPELAMGANDVVLVSLPFFHMFGCGMSMMPLLIGASLITLRRLPPSTNELLITLEELKVTTFFTTPFILEHIKEILEEDPSKAKAFQTIKYCLTGGASIDPVIGDFLRSQGLNLRSAIGSTEAGNIYVPNVSKSNNEWYQIRLSAETNRHFFLEPFDSNARTRQIIIRGDNPSLSASAKRRPNGDFETRDLVKEDPPNSGAWRIVGRIDDTLVMKNGEKTNPVPMEREITSERIIQRCAVIGESKSCTAVLVELEADQARFLNPLQTIARVYDAVERANKAAPSHSTIVVPHMVYILPLSKQLPITPKGTVMRKKAVQIFENEIEKMYSDFLRDTSSIGTSKALDTKEILARAAAQVLLRQPEEFDPNISLFDYGLDSLRATQLRNHIIDHFHNVPNNFLYEYPTLNSIVKALEGDCDNGTLTEKKSAQEEKRYQETQMILDNYLARIEQDFPTRATTSPERFKRHTVLLTGATGSLGAFLLMDMLQESRIEKVYCLVRGNRNRLQQSLKGKRIDEDWIFESEKLVVLSADLNDTHFGLDKATFDTLKEEVTMIQCCGWLVDFNQPVQHFERECIRNLYNMIRFAYRENNPMHVHVVSSISTTANYPEAIVPESAPPHDPHVALPMGYAQSKYIVEHIFAYLAENKGMPCFVERVGQLCGDTMYGSWNASEQYPLMMIGGAIMKMMPDLPFKVDWLPTDTAASAIYDIMIHSADNYHDENFFNVVNPRLIPWSKVLSAMKKCGMKFDIVSPQRWVDELRKDQSNPAYRLLWFYESNWLSTKKGPVWTTENAVTVSDSLEEAATFNSKLLSTCVSVWRESGFLKDNQF